MDATEVAEVAAVETLWPLLVLLSVPRWKQSDRGV